MRAMRRAGNMPGDYPSDVTAGIECVADAVSLPGRAYSSTGTRHWPLCPGHATVQKKVLPRSAMLRFPASLHPCRKPSMIQAFQAPRSPSPFQKVHASHKKLSTPGRGRGRDLGARFDRTCGTMGRSPGRIGAGTGCRCKKCRPHDRRVGLRLSRLLFPDHEIVLVGAGSGRPCQRRREM